MTKKQLILAKRVHVAVQYGTGRLCGSRTGFIGNERVDCPTCLAILKEAK